MSLIASRLASAPLRPAALTRLLEAAVVLVGLGALTFIATYHLGLYPTIWFDEGSLLHVPKNLILYGAYADRSSEGLRYFGPTIGVGPTVLLPVALAFKIAGIGLIPARLVIVGYLLTAVLLLGEAGRRQYGTATAGLAAILLVATPGIDFLYLGRQVAGEVPGLAYLLLGVLLWWRAVDSGHGRVRTLGLAGLAFGLAAVTKNQLGLLLVPTLALTGVLDRLYYRRLAPWHYLIPAAVTAGLVLVEYAVLLILPSGLGHLGETIALWRNASTGAIFVFSPGRVLASLKFLAGPEVFGCWGIPALFYSAILAREKNPGGLKQAFLTVFAAVGLAWYAFGSVGWPRYAFPSLAVMTLFTARLTMDLLGSLWTLARSRGDQWPALATAAILAVTLAIGYGLGEQVQAIVRAADMSPQETAAYLDRTVPAGAIIETWEPELGFLSNRDFHYPPPSWLDRAVRAKWLAETNLVLGYDPIALAHPTYLVIGPFGQYTGLYDRLIATEHPHRIASFGQYDIYRLP
ncbi:MAG: glycosyltransferase family 39 protein [Chloroflexi bacterium]|nr:glycosyltransferase family 39 protein [Chloroflexota bacterium]